MTSRRGFICGGCWTLDRIKMIDQWPQQEALAVITDTDRQGGGSAHNLAIDMRKLDPSVPVEAIGIVGNDSDGDFLFQTALGHGVNVDQLYRTGDAETSYTDVMSDENTGKRTFFHHKGSNNLLTPDHFSFLLTRCRILHLGLLGLHQQLDSPWGKDPNGWVSVLRKAKQAGLQTNIELVSIDPGRIRDLCLPCLPWLDTLIVNDYEIGALADIETIRRFDIPARSEPGSDGSCFESGSFEGRSSDGHRSESGGARDGERGGEREADAGQRSGVQGSEAIPKQCVRAAKKVLALGSMRLVVVHYPEGAICVSRDGRVVETSSVKVDADHVVGTVGAGDAFAAGMLYGLHENWSIDASLQLAHAVAAASLRSQTTVGAVESVERCLALACR